MRFTPFDEKYECPDESYPDFGWAPDTSFAEPPTTEKCTYVTSAPNPTPPVNDDVIVDDVVDNDDGLLLAYYDDGCKDLPSTFCGNQMAGSYCKDYQSDSCGRSICQFDTFTMLNACPSPGSTPTSSPTASSTGSPTASSTDSPTALYTSSPTSLPTASSTGSPTGGEDDESVYLTKGCTALPSTFCGNQMTGSYCKDYQSDSCGRSICQFHTFTMLNACPSPGPPPTGSPTASSTGSPTASSTSSPTSLPTASSTGSPTGGEDDESVYLTTGCTVLPDAFCVGYNGGYCKNWQSDGCLRSICQGDDFSSLEACP